MREVNVAIADDNERILDMLGEIIEQDHDLNLIGKANNGEDMYHLIKEKEPDVVLLVSSPAFVSRIFSSRNIFSIHSANNLSSFCLHFP